MRSPHTDCQVQTLPCRPPQHLSRVRVLPPSTQALKKSIHPPPQALKIRFLSLLFVSSQSALPFLTAGFSTFSHSSLPLFAGLLYSLLKNLPLLCVVRCSCVACRR